MPNKNYQKGARFERKIVNDEREKGKIAYRSAGSHSKIDVTIIDIEKKEIKLLQCKKYKKKISGKERQEILDLKKYDGDYKVIFRLREKDGEV